MLKFRFFIISLNFTLITLNGFSQVEELKKNQDLRKDYVDFSKTSEKFNKTLELTKKVNVFIGTGAHGHTHPAATAPFGMIQLGPDTRYNGWDGCSGYHYSDSIIFGFSHTHLSGTGVEDLCDLLIVPQQGKAKTKALYEDKNGFGQKFSHQEEKAEPGYYQVNLKNDNIDVRLASSERSGIHEYTFNNPKGKKYILIDLDHRDKLLDVDLKIDKKSKKIISGKRVSTAWAKNQHFYFFLELDSEFTKSKLIGNSKLLLEFPENTKQLKIKVGISALDVDGAKKNLFEEIQGFDLDLVKNKTQKQWNEELNKIQFISEDETVETNFYTAIYHAYLTPTLFSDVDGKYRGNDNKIYQNLKNKRYTIFSLWDTYRSAHPLYTLTQAKRTEDFIQTFLAIYDETGELPVWELWGNETDCMIGYHATSVITDAYVKGITNFDTKKALNAMLASSKKNELGKNHFKNYGFISSNQEPESVSKTLEYAYDDWTIAEFASKINDQKMAKEYYNRSLNFINIFDPQTKFMRPKNGGIWLNPFIPSEVNFNFTEANSYQYSLAMPHNIQAMRQILGGKDSLESWLDRLFSSSSELAGRQQSDITGLIGQYAHGNEPSHHMAYLYNYTNSPYKTQEKVNQILHELYTPTPEGLSGNEDCGQMSAWYVLSALGIYPVSPGNPYYTFGRPLLESANMHFENGKALILKTINNSSENKYIQKIEWNGENYTKLYISHNELIKGGELIFTLGENPNLSLNSYEREISELDFIDSNFIPVPYFTATKNSFIDSITTEIKLIDLGNSSDFQIRYTTDGTEPNFSSPLYTKKLFFDKTTTLKAKAFRVLKNNIKVDETFESGLEIFTSDEKLAVSSTFYKLNKGISILLSTKYNNQYTGGGDLALIDGIFGSEDFRSGAWQGYEALNAEGKIEFEQNKDVDFISISCLQDIKSWIFMPTELQIQVSYDGINFEKAKILKLNYQFTEFGTFKEKFKINLNSKNVKSFKYSIVNRKTCPKGHLGEGEKSWIFVDEIEVK
jgi:predicted alpha-1,2-mannosidase